MGRYATGVINARHARHATGRPPAHLSSLRRKFEQKSLRPTPLFDSNSKFEFEFEQKSLRPALRVGHYVPICEAFANGVSHRWLSHRGSATATLKGRPADARRPVPQAAPPQHWHRARSEGTSAAPFDGGTGKVKERHTGRGVLDRGPRAGHSVAGPAGGRAVAQPTHPEVSPSPMQKGS